MNGVLYLAGFAIAATAFVNSCTAEATTERSPIVMRITDGDTFSIRTAQGVVKIRPIGFDTAETYRCECNRECALGARATEVLAEVLAPPASIEIRFTGQKSWNRALAYLFVDGRDLGDVMEERIPDTVHRGTTRKPGGWCG